MARTKGSKNKPKTITITKTEVDLANKLGLTTEQYAKSKLDEEVKALRKRGPYKKKPKVDWEKLAKDLQQALAKEIKENQDLYQTISSKETFIIQQAAIIQYLETKVLNIFRFESK